jgi:tetratricopeptide (TPR) repeat protein
MTRYFNWKLATVLVVAGAVFGTAVYALHRWQKGTRADQALPLGEKAYAAQNWEEAATQLGRYIAVNADDVPVLLKYADAQLNRRPRTSSNLQQAVGAYRSVLRLEEGNTEATRRLAEVYLEGNRPGEAELIAERYLEKREDLTIRRLLGIALLRQRKFAQAETELDNIIAKEPNQVLAYEAMGYLAQLRPDDVNKPTAFWFDEAVAHNPESALAYIVRASFRRQRNERDGALADLEQAQKRDVSETEVRLRLIQELLYLNALDQARGQLTALQAVSPSNQMLWRCWAELALRLNSPDEMSRVAEAGVKELAAQPWDFMPVAVELYIRSNHFDKAGDLLTRLRQKDILPAAVAYLDGLLAERQGKLREAVAGWQKAVSLGYPPSKVRLLLASVFTRLGDVPSAISELRTLVAQDPANLEGHVNLARLLAQTRDWPEALNEARRVEQLAPGYTDGILLGLQAQAQMLAAEDTTVGREEAWRSIEERLMQLDKTGDRARQIELLQAQIAVMRGKFSEAESLVTELEGRYPAEMNLMLLHAELYASQGKEQEAIARYRDIMEKFPQASEPVRGLALVLARQTKSDECESVVRQALARIEEPRARRDLGLLLADLYRRWEQQDQLYRWLTELDQQMPNDIPIKRQLLACRRVQADAPQAQKRVDEIEALEGDTGWQWKYEQARVWTLVPDVNEFKKRHYPETVKLLQENLLANPDDQASRLLLGVAYERGGELTSALATYREALSRSPDNIRVIVPTVAALYKAQEFTEAQEILDRATRQGLEHPELQKLKLQIDLRRGAFDSASDILQGFLSQDPNNMSYSLTLALVRMQEKDFAGAQKILDELRAKTPDSRSVIAAQVRLQILLGNDKEAVRLCDEAVQSLPGAFAYTLRAQTYVALKQNEKALEDFDRAVAREPKNADVWVARSAFYRSLGRRTNAISDARQALTLSPDSLPVQKHAIALFLASGDSSLIREAEGVVDKALDRVSGATAETAQLQLLKARVLLFKGTNPATEAARVMLRGITDKYPRYAEAWEWLARLELQQGEPGRAVDTALRGLAHNPENRQLLLLKALAEKETSPASAALTLRGLADQYPQDVEILVELADACVRADRSEQALELLRQRLPGFQGPARRRGEMTLAAVLYKSGQRDEAKSLFSALMQAEPGDATPLITLAQLLARERRWSELNQLLIQWRNTHPDETATTVSLASALAGTGEKDAIQVAEDLLRVTLERDPKSMASLMLLSMLMQSVGRSDESVALNRKALEVDPNNIIAMNNLAWVLCEEKGQFEEALQLAQKGLAIDPEYKDLIDTRGMVFYRQGDYEKAAADFLKCIELYPAHLPSSVAPRFHLARVYAQTGRTAQAIALLKEALGTQERIGGLSSQDVADAKLLLDQLQKGN